MERAILETLIYADIFDYPLKAWEIHKWLIKKEAKLSEVEKGLGRLLKRKVVIEKDGYFALKGRVAIIKKRILKIEPSKKYLRDAQFFSTILRIIPWIKLIGISGNLAMENASEEDDIDLFVVAEHNRLWLTRLFSLLLLSLLERRRVRGESRKSAAGKFCLNLLLEEDQLTQERKNLYIAHEVLQMRVLWDRDKMYEQFLLANEWVFRFLPNWHSSQPLLKSNGLVKRKKRHSSFVSFLEKVVRFIQLRYMGKPDSVERVGQVAVYFHPEDVQPFVLKEFERRAKKQFKR